MKITTILPVILLSFGVSAFQCRKNNNSYSGECIKGQLIDALCASYVIKITDGNYDPSRVVNNWQDPQSGTTYDKVFAVSNFCDIQGKLTPGQELTFVFEDGGSDNSCVTCMAIRAVPPKSNKIKLTTTCQD